MKAMAAQMTTQNTPAPTPSSSYADGGQASAGADPNSALVPAIPPPILQSQTTAPPETVSGSL